MRRAPRVICNTRRSSFSGDFGGDMQETRLAPAGQVIESPSNLAPVGPVRHVSLISALERPRDNPGSYHLTTEQSTLDPSDSNILCTRAWPLTTMNKTISAALFTTALFLLFTSPVDAEILDAAVTGGAVEGVWRDGVAS